jgi:HK97 family phage major capsid protein
MNVNYNLAKTLREERAAIHDRALRVLNTSEQTAETRSQFDRAMNDIKGLNARIAAAENSTPGVIGSGNPNEELAFGRFLRGGIDAVGATEKRYLRRETRDGRESRDIAEGSQNAHIGTYTGLGFFVPTGFRAVIEQATKYFCPLSDESVSGCQIMNTDTGNVIPMPTSNDTTTIATLVGEAAAVTESDGQGGNLGVSQILIQAWKFTSGLVKVSDEQLQDSSFDIEAWLGQRFGERFGRALEQYYTTGTGVTGSQPMGILTAVEASGVTPVIATGASSNTGNAGQTYSNSIGSIDLVNLEHGVDPSYRRGAKYMFNDTTLGSLQSLLDKYGRPLWTPSVQVGAPAMLNGYPYIINQSMPSIAAATNPIVFGDFSKFIIRKVNDLSVRRLSELYAINFQVGFISSARTDSQLLDAGTHPLNLLEMHS